MNLTWYYTFLIVAKYQNYHKASKDLFITQTTVYNHIKNLESLLNVKLVKSIGKNIMLTKEGHEFIPLAQKTIKVYEKGIFTIKNLKV